MNFGNKARLINAKSVKTEYTIERTPFLIGRKATAGLFLPDFNVSREHAMIEEEDGNFTIRDMGSVNGTMLNHRRIGTDPVPLRDDDEIVISRSHVFIFASPERTMPFFDPLIIYGLEIDQDTQRIYVDGVPVSPDRRGFQLICLLAEVPGKVVSYAEIGERLYPEDQDPDSQLKRIRAAKNDFSKRLKAAGVTRQLIRSRNGVGYQLSED